MVFNTSNETNIGVAKMHALLSTAPEPKAEPIMTEFGDANVTGLIANIAQMDATELVAFAWINFDLDLRFGMADVLINQCKAWMLDPVLVYSAVGTSFWTSMKSMALEIFKEEEIDQYDLRDDRKYND
jgi:hypothetical protein